MTAPDTAALARRAEAMLGELAAISAEPGRIVRLFLTPEHRRAADLVAQWMAAAGLVVSEDALGTVRGRLSATVKNGKERVLLLGSHIDTVVDAGRYDGCLGVVAAILAVEEARRRGLTLPFAIEVLAFGDEEGVRFPTALTSSCAVAGRFDPKALEARDRDGVTLAEAIHAFGGDPARIGEAAVRPGTALGYVEAHIEQGPVLERDGLPLGVVTAIAGATRARIEIAGEAGHAGTVPMALRRDALAAAADLVLKIEAIGRAGAADGLVATVGRIEARPGAVNVIPGAVEMTLDLRAAADAPRKAALAAIEAAAAETAAARGVGIAVAPTHDQPTVPCAAGLRTAIGSALTGLGLPPVDLMSGAGHDGQAMAALCDIGMLFVRCRGGISHNPAEHASVEDMGLAVEALVRLIESLARREALHR
jgi:allantoate deiminase